MKLNDLPTNAEVRERALQDAEFRAEWERTALARAVALRLVQYRVENKLTQTALARILGMHQAAIGRLESGEHNPSLETLQRLSKVLGIDFHIQIDVTPDSFRLTA